MAIGEARFNRRLDKIRQLEESGVLKQKKKGSRALAKFKSNKLAVVGLIIFAIIFLACVFAPLVTPYNPETVDRSEERRVGKECRL